jgi:two-component system, NarL family, sensor kinase
MPRWLHAFRSRLTGTIGGQVLSAFELTVLVALLVALVSLSATKEATQRLENLEQTQRRMVSAMKDLELGAELQRSSVQAYLLSGDQRYLDDQAAGQARFENAFSTLSELTAADEGLDRLDDIRRAQQRFEDSASSQLALYQQGWQRSATFLWRTEGQESKQRLEQQIEAYRNWYQAAVETDISAARVRGQAALVIAILLISLAAAGGLFIGIRLTRSITSRLGKLGAAARAIAHDDFSVRASVTGTDEVAALAASMNRMAEHLEESQRALDDSRSKLRESLERYRLLAENAIDIVYAIDAAGRYTYVNPAMERVAGYRPDEMVGRCFDEFIPEELRSSRRESFERRMRGEDVDTTAEIEFMAKDGRRVPLELRLGAIERDGEIVGMQGIARDITRRKAMEAEVRRLADQEHRRAEQLQEVARVSRKIARLASLDELLPNVANLLHEIFGYERVEIFLLDPESRLASLRASAGRYSAPVPLLFSLREDQGIVGWVASRGGPLCVGDVRSDPRYVRMPGSEGTLSELAVPIQTGGQTLGVLNIESLELNRFDPNDEAMVVILARQIATVIQNARLFEQRHNLAVAEERNRLAREIHDTLAQGLTAITLQLEVADALLDIGPEQARPKIAKALDLTRANLEEARRSVMDLRAAPLQERTLGAALQDLVGSFGRDQGLNADFGARGVGSRLPAPVEAGLYRIAQEALNNVAKHADASAVHVTLEQEDGSLVLAVEDDGAGFDSHRSSRGRRKGGFGLIGMQERARLLGGQLEVTSTPASGTRIVVTVPAPNRSQAADKPASEGSRV